MCIIRRNRPDITHLRVDAAAKSSSEKVIEPLLLWMVVHQVGGQQIDRYRDGVQSIAAMITLHG